MQEFDYQAYLNTVDEWQKSTGQNLMNYRVIQKHENFIWVEFGNLRFIFGRKTPFFWVTLKNEDLVAMVKKDPIKIIPVAHYKLSTEEEFYINWFVWVIVPELLLEDQPLLDIDHTLDLPQLEQNFTEPNMEGESLWKANPDMTVN